MTTLKRSEMITGVAPNPFRVVLHRRLLGERREFVTHCEEEARSGKFQELRGGRFWGYYHTNRVEAEIDFYQRCHRYGVQEDLTFGVWKPVMQNLLVETRALMEQETGCDHSVNICFCSTYQAMDAAAEMLGEDLTEDEQKTEPNESECDKAGVHNFIEGDNSFTFEVFWENKAHDMDEGWYWIHKSRMKPGGDSYGPFNTSNAAYDDAMNSEFSE